MTRSSAHLAARLRPLAIGMASRLCSLALTVATGLAAALPVIVSTIHAIQADWTPIADRGIIATRAHDVFTSHAPLVGQYTLAGEVTGHVTHSLGPLLFWLLALPAHAGSTVGMTVTIGAMNTLAIVGSVALARRRGGKVLMVMSAVAIALMCQSLAAETFHDVWNNSVALFPLTLLIFMCWSIACGDVWLLPGAVLVASFAMQAHLAYLPPSLGLLALAVIGLTIRILVGRRSAPARAPAGRSLLLWSLATILVAGLCWSAPIINQTTERPGNLTRVIEAATKPHATQRLRVGWYAVVRAAGITPWWLRDPKSKWQRKYEVHETPSSLATDSCLLMLGALIAVALIAALRRRGDLTALALAALIMCAALAAVAKSTPTIPIAAATLGYTMWWGSQVGMIVWLTLAWSAWLGLRWALGRAAATSLGLNIGEHPGLSMRKNPATHARVARVRAIAPVVLSLVGLAGTAVVGQAVAAIGKPDEHVALYRPTRIVADRLEQLIPPGSTILMEGNLDGATMPLKPGIRYLLVTHDIRVLAPGSYLRLGTWYELYDRPYQEAVYLSDRPRPPVEGVKLVAQASFREYPGTHTIYAWLSRKPGR